MAAIKSYTDLSQSKVLAEILPIESADMYYMETYCNGYTIGVLQKSMERDMLIKQAEYYKMFPCWSLAALLSVLPNSIYDNTDEFSQLEFSKISVAYHDMNDGIKVGSIKDNLVDACYELVLKLHELKKL